MTIIINAQRYPKEVHQSMEAIVGKKRNPLTRPAIRGLRNWLY